MENAPNSAQPAKHEYLLQEEIRSEHWVSGFRLAIGFLLGILFGIDYLQNTTSSQVFLIQASTIFVVLIYSCFSLLYHGRREPRRFPSFVFTFLDVTVVSGILGAYALMPAISNDMKNILFSAYFIAIAFTALHHRAVLSIFGGILAAAEFSVLYYFFFMAPGESLLDGRFLMQIAFLLGVAAISGFVSLNNLRALRKTISSETRYQNLVQRLPDMLFTLDDKGLLAWTNKASQAILGIPAKDVRGRKLRDFLVNPEEFKLRSDNVKQLFKIKDASNELKFVDCIVRRVQEEKGPPVWEGSMTDVTDREFAVAQREEMANRLYQYQKMESVGALASGMAHDFNNVLQALTDIVDQVQKSTRESETRNRMQLCADTLIDAKFMTSELLALGRRNPLDSKTINLRNFFNAIVPQFQNQLGPRFTIAINLPEEKLAIQGDPDYLKRIFQNLINNSRDVMPRGGRMSIECAAQRKEGEAPTIVIRFTDEGSGIPSEIIGKIFDPFFTTKKLGKGTGLGLALVQRIVALHNGRVSVENTGKSGTTFRIEIPESEFDSEDMDTKHILMNRVSTTVLLLDDDYKIRDILKIFILGLGYKTIEASNQDEAVEALTKNRAKCEVAIMDWRLGSDDPHQVIQRMRAIKPELIVFVVSGYPPKQKSIDQMKIQKWFTKPYEKNVLDIEIQKAMYKLRTEIKSE
jgi:PAS domain S-box-containing protein